MLTFSLHAFRLSLSIPQANLTVWIDDLVLSVQALSHQWVVEEMVRLLKRLACYITDSLQAEIAFEKIGTIATSHKVAVELQQRLGKFARVSVVPPVNLGIDDLRGRKRRLTSASKWSSRWKHLKKRASKLQRIARTIGRGKARLHKIETTGLLPAVGFGCSIACTTFASRRGS